MSGGMATAATSIRSPRTFASAAEWARDVVGVAQRSGPLAAVYLRGRLDATLRERVMVAVSRVNACGGCTFVHQRWALRAGVSSEELEAIGLGDLAALDERSRTAVVYASALAEGRFRRRIAPEITAAAAEHLSVDEMSAIEAVARLMALANLSVSTAEAIGARARRRTVNGSPREPESPTVPR
jgi:AhpD family alkylhydroperoxidase